MNDYDGPILDEDREEAVRLLAYSFSNIVDAQHIVGSTPAERMYAIRRDGVLAGVIRWDIEQVFVHGVPRSVATGGALTVHPALRGGDWAATYAARVLTLLRDQGVVLAGWRTQITGWWHRMGWSLGSVYTRYIADPTCLRPIDKPDGGRVELSADTAGLMAVHDAAVRQRFGFLVRDQSRWAALRGGPGSEREVALWRGTAGEPEGYMIYRNLYMQPDLENRSGQRQMIVDELVTVTSSAYLGLLGFLAGHNTVSKLRWDAPQDDPLLSVLREPRQVRAETVVDKVLRVLNVGELTLPVLGDEAAVDGLLITVDDPLPWNRGPWRVTVDDHMVRFEPSPTAADACRIRVHALGPLISRYLSVDNAMRTGLVSVPDDKASDALHRLFTPTLAPYSPDAW